jgi:molybdenum cofactor synthesis domain-containing protein
MPTAGIVIIGDEILSGKFVEENATFLIGELRVLGVDLRRVAIVPDDMDDIATSVTEASGRYDHVFTSGGVGPTHDDITMAAIARGFGTTVMRHPDLEERVRGYWKDQLADANLRLAEVPSGAELVYGSDAEAKIWPVVCYRNVYILPGVPTLFRRKFVEIRDRFRSEPVTAARLYLDIEEGELAPELHAIVAAHPSVRVGSYPRFAEREFRVMVTLEGPLPEAVSAAYETLTTRLGKRVVRRDDPRRVG